ncbi:MAG TPA: hypothetical protein DCM87_05295 [Planctomycetes bacterium]|nr:hypothetical protein [Planctomycetota bacterium]
MPSMPTHARLHARKPGARSSPALFAAIAGALLLAVLFVMNREARTTPPPEQTSATSVESDRSKTETKPKPAPTVAKSDPPRAPEPAAPVSAAMAPVKAPPEPAPALTVETEEATPAPARAEEAREPEKARSVVETVPPAPEAAEQPVTPKKPRSAEKKTPPSPEAALSLSLDEIEKFLGDVRGANVKTETAGGLEVTATLIPDTLAFRAAEKAKELFRKGNGREKVLAEVRKYFASNRRAEGGKPLIEISVSPAGGWVLFMTTAGLQKSFKVRYDDSAIACEVAALTSLPSVTKWKIWFGKIAGTNEPKTVPLHYIARPLSVRLAAKDRWPSGKNLTLSVLDFCHVLGKRRGSQDTEGVNTGMQQIHKPDLDSFKTQAEVLFTRSEYREVEPPAAFKTLLEK